MSPRRRRTPLAAALAAILGVAGLAGGGGLVAAAAVPRCPAPECLVVLGPPAATEPGAALIASAHREPGAVALVLARPALVSVTAHGDLVDRWLAPAGQSVHPLPGRRALRVHAVDGAGVSAGTAVAGAPRAARRAAQPARAAAIAARRVENT